MIGIYAQHIGPLLFLSPSFALEFYFIHVNCITTYNQHSKAFNSVFAELNKIPSAT